MNPKSHISSKIEVLVRTSVAEVSDNVVTLVVLSMGTVEVCVIDFKAFDSPVGCGVVITCRLSELHGVS